MTTEPILHLYTINEAALIFPGLTAFRIRTLIKTGELQHIRAGKKYLVCGEVIKNFIYQNGRNNGIILESGDPVTE